MGNSISTQLITNYLVFIKIMEMLEAEDQLVLTRVHKDIEQFFLEHIWKEKFNLDTSIIDFDENFNEFITEKYENIKTLNVNGGLVRLNVDRLTMLINLNEISLNDMDISIGDVYRIPEIAVKLEILKLENINYIGPSNTEQSGDQSFKVESLKKLHLPFHQSLSLFIANCPNLDELIINNICHEDIELLNHSLLSRDHIYSTLSDDILKDHKIVCGDNMYADYEIIVKKNHSLSINVQCVSLDLEKHCDNYVEKFDLMHLENAKELHIMEGLRANDVEKIIKLLSENCRQIKILELIRPFYFISMPNINTLSNLKKIVFWDGRISEHDLFRILRDINLYSLVINCIILGFPYPPITETYGHSIKILECNGDKNIEESLFDFLEAYPNGFHNVKKLHLTHCKSTKIISKLVPKYFYNIKYLEIEMRYMHMSQRVLTTLVKLPLLKYLKLRNLLLYDSNVIEYLKKSMNVVIVN